MTVPDHIGPLCDAMHERVYGHQVTTCRSCTEPLLDFATEARAVLDSTDPRVHAAMLDALTRHGVLTEDGPTDGSRPHKFPTSAIGEEVVAWTCQACGEVIREFGPYEPGECAVDWRDTGQRRLVTPWEVTE